MSLYLTEIHNKADEDVKAIKDTQMSPELAADLSRKVQETFAEFSKAGASDNVTTDIRDYLTQLNKGLNEKFKTSNYDYVELVDKGIKGQTDSADGIRVWRPISYWPDAKYDFPLCPPKPETRDMTGTRINDYKQTSGLFNR